MKICKKCDQMKPESEFDKDKRKKDGFNTKCKKCTSEVKKRWHEANKEKTKRRLSEKKEEVDIYKKEYHKKNKEKIAKRKKKYDDKNRDLIRARNNKYYQTEEGKESIRRGNLKRRALKLSTEDGTITKESLKELRELQNNKCYYCECELEFDAKNKVHLDHHIPLSRGGIHSISNVKYTCKECNLSKKAKMPNSLLIL